MWRRGGGGDVTAVGGPFVRRRGGLGPAGRGWAFGGGLNINYSFGVWFGVNPTTNKTPASCISKV
jgi:hypothetical protein